MIKNYFKLSQSGLGIKKLTEQFWQNIKQIQRKEIFEMLSQEI